MAVLEHVVMGTPRKRMMVLEKTLIFATQIFVFFMSLPAVLKLIIHPGALLLPYIYLYIYLLIQ